MHGYMYLANADEFAADVFDFSLKPVSYTHNSL